MSKSALLDTNLLVLFIVGGTDRSLIRIHKNCSQFKEEDYDDLLRHIAAARGLVTTSHILSETSNLIRQVKDPIRSDLAAFLKLYIMNVQELRPLSVDATNDENYAWLGLNDASILTCLDEDRVLITSDGNLYAAAVGRSGHAFHFSQLKTKTSEW